MKPDFTNSLIVKACMETWQGNLEPALHYLRAIGREVTVSPDGSQLTWEGKPPIIPAGGLVKGYDPTTNFIGLMMATCGPYWAIPPANELSAPMMNEVNRRWKNIRKEQKG